MTEWTGDRKLDAERFLSKLSSRNRAIVVLNYYYGMTETEISFVFGIARKEVLDIFRDEIKIEPQIIEGKHRAYPIIYLKTDCICKKL